MKDIKRYIIGLDEGTTSVRTVVYDVIKKSIVCVKQQRFKQFYPKEGYVEHDAEEIYRATVKTMNQAFDELNIKKDEVYSIGITNQRETVVAWNKDNGKPVCNAIVWQCRRTMDYCKKLSLTKGRMIKNRTGLLVDAYFSATKMQWLIENNKEVQNLISQGKLCFGTMDSFLVYRLSEGKSHITDITNASRTMLMNIHTNNYDTKLLKLFKIPLETLPKIVDNCGDLAIAKTKIGFLPIRSMIGDQQSSLFGQGCFDEGMAKNTYGTGAFLLINTGSKLYKSPSLLNTIAWRINGKTSYALEGSVFCAGANIEWLKDVGLLEDAKLVDKMIKKSNCEDLYYVPALTGLGAPYWDSYARGLLIGLTRGSTKEDIVKAVIESIAFSVDDILHEMAKTKIKISKLRVDGGVSNSDYLTKFQANLSNVEIEKPKSSEGTVLGAIYLAGLGTAFKSLDEIKKLIEIKSKVMPDKSASESLQLRLNKYHMAVERSKSWANK